MEVNINIDGKATAYILIASIVLAMSGAAYAASDTGHIAKVNNEQTLELIDGRKNFTIEVGGQFNSDQYSPVVQLQDRRRADIVETEVLNESHIRVNMLGYGDYNKTVNIVAVKE